MEDILHFLHKQTKKILLKYFKSLNILKYLLIPQCDYITCKIIVLAWTHKYLTIEIKKKKKKRHYTFH